jgi:hypothetical protein
MPLLPNFAIEYAIRMVQENQVGLKLNGTRRMLVDAVVMTLLGDNIDTITKNTETLIQPSKEVCLEVTKYTLLSRHQDVRKNQDLKIGNRSFENVAQFRYLGVTVTNSNLIQEEIKRRLNSGTASYHSAENILSSGLLCKNVKIRI